MRSYIQMPDDFVSEAATYNHEKNNYKFYLCELLEGGKIVINEGFEFPDDARDRKREQALELGPSMKDVFKFAIYSGKFLKSKGVDPDNDSNWGNPSYMKIGPNEPAKQSPTDFNPTKVWKFLDSRPFNNPDFRPKFSSAEDIYKQHIESDPEAKAKYDAFDFEDDGYEHESERSNRGRRDTYNSLAGKNENVVTDQDEFVNEIYQPGRHHVTHAVTRSRNTGRSPHNVGRNVKDVEDPRPTRMAPKPETNMSPRGEVPELYLQDQASDVMIDKYGLQKGYDLWQNSIGAGPRGGAMFAISASIVKEKAKMIRDLALAGHLSREDQQAFLTDYFHRSYFDLWKIWRKEIKHETRPLKFATNQDDQVTQETPATEEQQRAHRSEEDTDNSVRDERLAAISGTPTPQSTAQRIERHAKGNKLNSLTNNNIVNRTGMTARSGRDFDIKDSQRIIDMVQKAGGSSVKAIQLAHQMADAIKDKAKMKRRWKAAEDLGQNDIANVFFDRTQDWAQHENRVLMFDSYVALNESEYEKLDKLIKYAPINNNIIIEEPLSMKDVDGHMHHLKKGKHGIQKGTDFGPDYFIFNIDGKTVVFNIEDDSQKWNDSISVY